VSLGAALGIEDFDTIPLVPGLAVVSTDALIERKSVNVAAAVLASVIAGASTCDFRLRFETPSDGDAGTDQALFTASDYDDGTGFVPTLEVSFIPP
jgi:hypothetical protein